MDTYLHRRNFLRLTGSAAAAALVGGGLAACGDAFSSDTPNKAGTGAGRKVRLGFIALTDCSPLVIAKEKGFFAELDLDVELIKQASWPTTRDNLLNGQIDAAHCLFSMPMSVAAGISGSGTDLKIAMVLSQNGQAITLKKDFAAAGYGDLAAAKSLLEKASPTLAMTYPGGTHDTWLRYWLQATKANKDKVKIIPIPPPQMVANMKANNMDGFCVGEPWPAAAVQQGIGFTHITTQDIWQHHPEKALVTNARFAAEKADVLQDVMVAVFKACQWLDKLENRTELATILAPANYVNTAAENIKGRLLGKYEIGAGLAPKEYVGDQMMFFRDGLVNLPRRSHVYWFLSQYQRFGLLKEAPPYAKIADSLLLTDLYAKAAQMAGVTVANDDMKPFEIKLDGVTFDPAKPEEEAKRP
jgi:nitrate/nitrite transport system substrate-binding protein